MDILIGIICCKGIIIYPLSSAIVDTDNIDAHDSPLANHYHECLYENLSSDIIDYKPSSHHEDHLASRQRFKNIRGKKNINTRG